MKVLAWPDPQYCNGYHSRLHTSDLPLRAVLAPETNTILARTVTSVLVVQLNQTSTECSAALLDLPVCEPLIAIKGLGDLVEWAPADAVVVGVAVG